MLKNKNSALMTTMVIVCLSHGGLIAQDQTSAAATTATTLKKLSMEELMNVEVVSVSTQPQRLGEVPSAIQVITQEDIRRSTATSLPEVLRLATNLQVMQFDSYSWIISARGFNTAFSNKLLVMIDGRTVYSPLFAGVFWDAQQVLLEDIERVEVISGPGGTMWGANAVNGVINIITKRSQDTQGLYVSAAAGNQWRGYGGIRYGGTIGSNVAYRVYGQYNDRNNTFYPDLKDTTGGWTTMHTGFNLDWTPTEKNTIMIQGNAYTGNEYVYPAKSTFDGQNIISKWTHVFSTTSTFTLQLYFDRTWRRDTPSTISDELDTYDFDFQHAFQLGKSHAIVWGIGYRFMKDKTQNGTPIVGFVPADKDMPLFSTFVQDNISVVPEKLELTIGTKLQHNVYSDFELQPSARIAFTPATDHTIWGAVSRAIRAPSRIDVDYHLPTYPLPPESPSVAGGPNFVSEKALAYELGYRTQPSRLLSLSLATFYNVYDDIYSVEALPNTLTYQIQNGSEAESWGVELSGLYQLIPTWRVRGGYTFLNIDLRSKPGHNFDPSYLSIDPEHQFLLQSMIDLPANFELDIIGRYVDGLPKTTATEKVPSYGTVDARLAWHYKSFEI